MIVKVQLSLVDGSSGKRALVYNADKSIQWECPAPEDIVLIMGGRAKAFFHARIDGQRRIALGSEAPWQEW